SLEFVSLDAAGNESLPTVVSYDLDTEAEPVLGLTAKEVNHSVELEWTPVVNVDNDFAAYLIFRSDEDFTSTEGMTAFWIDTDLNADSYIDRNGLPGETYYYGIVMVDQLGNQSPEPISTVSITMREGHHTAVRWVVGTDQIPENASYDLYLSANQISLVPTPPLGAKVYEGSVIADGKEYYWQMQFTPSNEVAAENTKWSAFVNDSYIYEDTISP